MAQYTLDYDIYKARPDGPAKRRVSFIAANDDKARDMALDIIRQTALEGQICVYRGPTLNLDCLGYAIVSNGEPARFQDAEVEA